MQNSKVSGPAGYLYVRYGGIMPLSKKQLEKMGIAYVAERLYREGLRFAIPDIDDGIDLIIYNRAEENQFAAVPVQLKAFSDEEFYSDKKYLKIKGLFMVYLWHVGTNRPVRAFGMEYAEVEKIVDQRGWSRHNGVYAITRGTNPLRDSLHPFEITNWNKLFFGVNDRHNGATDFRRNGASKKG